MRRALAKSLFSAGAVAFLALIPASGAFSENAGSKGAQIVASSADTAQSAAENLNTVPDDEFSTRDVANPESSLVRRLMAARPNEDLVICVAGCFSGRDRVVYAQPADKTSVLDKQSMNGRSEGTTGAIALSLRPSQ